MKTKKILTLSKMKKDENDVNQQKEERHQYRVKILQKIEELEREGKFDVDAEEDPATIVLTPENINYLKIFLQLHLQKLFLIYLTFSFLDNLCFLVLILL